MDIHAAVLEFQAEGCTFPLRLLTADEIERADELLTRIVEERPTILPAEDLLNLHMTVPEVYELCRHPTIIQVARLMLQTENVSVFTSRILCKLPFVGKEIPYHQDSNYWPLIPPGETAVHPRVASIWLALDDVTDENGPMDVLPFSACPASRGRNVDELLIRTNSSDDSGFDNFNITLDGSKLSGARRVLIKRGEAEFHSAWTIHRSDPNRSSVRRLAFIVRYCATGTIVQPGIRGSFDADYKIVPVAGEGVAGPPDRATGLRVYEPCMGNSAAQLAALKR
jgi:ectoine hydroxylase-related dioxygenase (phytanoyl-CoA dioxygenase family)